MASHRYHINAVLSVSDDTEAREEESTIQVPHPLLAVGSYDGNVRLVSTRSWAVAFVLPSVHPSEMMPMMNQGVVTTVEVVSQETDSADDSVFLFATKR